MSWIGDKAEATANVLKEMLMQTPAAKLYREGPQNVLAALLNTREEEWRSKMQAMPKPFDASPEAVNRDMEAAMAFWNPAGMVGKIVYHGSPHKFDKFDASKIGTGEGAQAYGHGIYAADQPTTAASYKKAGTSDKWDDSKGVMEAIYEAIGPMPDGSVTFGPLQTRYAKDAFINQGVKDGWSTVYEKLPPSLQKKVNDAIEPPGNLYKADLPDEWIPKMLDWDKPIGQQPEVQRALGMRVVKETEPSDSKWLVEFATGKKVGFKTKRDAMTYMTESTGGDVYRAYDPSGAIAARQLQPLGIPGIRYLDGGSRGAGQGSYNYVVFPGLEDKVKILERNGQPVNMIADALMRSRR